MLKGSRSLLLRYGVAFASAALAVLIRGLLTPLWGDELPFLTLFPAVLLSAWYGGLGPGLVTTILCATAAGYFWLGPFSANWLGFGLAVLVMLLIARLTAALRQSEARYRTISELVSDYAYAVQITPKGQGVVEWVTEAFHRITGFTAHELAAAGGLERLIHPADWPLVRQRLRDLFAGQPGFSEHRILTRQGEVRWLRDYSAPEWAPAHKRIVRVTGAGQDITAQRRAEVQFHSLINTTQDAVISIDRQGHLDVFNPAAERIFGYTRAEVQGQKVQLLMPEPYASEHDEYVARYERTGERRAIGRIRTVAARRKNGEVFPIELSVTEFALGSEVRYGAFIRDISEKVHLQERLIERERLAAIGTTVAKLAHEIGNPLNSMTVATQLLQRRLDRQREVLDEKVFTDMQLLRGEIARLSQLLQEFRSLSRQQQFAFQPTDLITVVQEIVAAEIAHYTERGISVEQNLPTDLPLVMADRDKIKQVVLNLCKNAFEAMPEGGTLTVRLHNTGEHITLEVADSGMGIPAGVDIFEPFVTTKPEGTGLGLPIVRQIVAAHSGTLTYTSEPGTGTIFTVTLPLALPAGAASKE